MLNNTLFFLKYLKKIEPGKTVFGQKTKMAMAALAALLLSFLLVGISYLLVPSKSSQKPLPMPEPSMQSQIFMAFLWIGLVVLISIAAFGTILLVNRLRKKTEIFL